MNTFEICGTPIYYRTKLARMVQIVFVREKIFLQIFIIPATIYYVTILFLLLFLIRGRDALWHCQLETLIWFLGEHGGRSLQGVFMVCKRMYFGLGMSVRWIIFICSVISTFQELKVMQFAILLGNVNDYFEKLISILQSLWHTVVTSNWFCCCYLATVSSAVNFRMFVGKYSAEFHSSVFIQHWGIVI